MFNASGKVVLIYKSWNNSMFAVLNFNYWVMTDEYVYSNLPGDTSCGVNRVSLMCDDGKKGLVWVYRGSEVVAVGSKTWRIRVW